MTDLPVVERLRSDIEKEKARESRDAWSAGFVYGMQHALRMVEGVPPSQPPGISDSAASGSKTSEDDR